MTVLAAAPRGALAKVTGVIPALLAVSHGTSSAEGDRAVAGLVRAVAARADVLGRLGEVGTTAESDDAARAEVRAAFVDVQQPDVPSALAALDGGPPVVVVPLLLSAGYHVHVDLARTVAATPRDVVLAAALGPDERLVDVLERRLVEAGLLADDVVVLCAAGSSDPRAVADCRTVATMLAARTGREIEAAFISAAEPEIGVAVRAARAANLGRRVVVSTYLLAPGYFADLAAAAPADVVTAPLLVADEPAPAELVALVLDRYAAAVRTRAS